MHLLFFQSSTESESCFKGDVTFWTPARSPCDGVIITFVYASHRCADGKTIAANQVDPKLEAAGFGCWREISDSDSIRRRRRRCRDDHAGCERMVPVFDDRLIGVVRAYAIRTARTPSSSVGGRHGHHPTRLASQLSVVEFLLCFAFLFCVFCFWCFLFVECWSAVCTSTTAGFLFVMGSD